MPTLDQKTREELGLENLVEVYRTRDHKKLHNTDGNPINVKRIGESGKLTLTYETVLECWIGSSFVTVSYKLTDLNLTGFSRVKEATHYECFETTPSKPQPLSLFKRNFLIWLYKEVLT